MENNTQNGMTIYLTKEWQNRPSERWRAQIVIDGQFTDVVGWFATKRAAIAWGATWWASELGYDPLFHRLKITEDKEKNVHFSW